MGIGTFYQRGLHAMDVKYTKTVTDEHENFFLLLESVIPPGYTSIDGEGLNWTNRHG